MLPVGGFGVDLFGCNAIVGNVKIPIRDLGHFEIRRGCLLNGNNGLEYIMFISSLNLKHCSHVTLYNPQRRTWPPKNGAWKTIPWMCPNLLENNMWKVKIPFKGADPEDPEPYN